MNLKPADGWRNYNPFAKDRNLIRIHVDYNWKYGLIRFILRQFIAFLLILLGLFLAIPSVPGPGWLSILFGMFIGSYPGKQNFISWIRTKKLFRTSRVILRKRYRILLVLPRKQLQQTSTRVVTVSKNTH